MHLALYWLKAATGDLPVLMYMLVFGRSSIRYKVSSPFPRHYANCSLYYPGCLLPASTTMNQILADQISSLEHGPTNGEATSPDPARSSVSLQAARSIIASVDRSPAIRIQIGSDRWLRLVNILQKLAYEDPDAGSEVDIALWCERQWATQLQNEPENETALRGKPCPLSAACIILHPLNRANSFEGLGHAWLMKSQQALARIYHEQGSSSTDTSCSSLSRNGVRTRATNNRDTARVNSEDYVEARDLLRPAMESLDRAIEVSEARGTVSGELLTLVSIFREAQGRYRADERTGGGGLHQLWECVPSARQ
jgi:hypothetical protein